MLFFLEGSSQFWDLILEQTIQELNCKLSSCTLCHKDSPNNVLRTHCVIDSAADLDKLGCSSEITTSPIAQRKLIYLYKSMGYK